MPDFWQGFLWGIGCAIGAIVLVISILPTLLFFFGGKWWGKFMN